MLFLANTATAAVNEYVLGRASVTDQLSQPAVTDMYQDSRGFLWILTQEGLNRFDGKENRIFRADLNNPGSISLDAMRGIVEDANGTLWFATDGGGLNRYLPETESFKTLVKGTEPSLSPYSDSIWSINLGINGKIWVGYSGGGFSVFDPDTGLFKHFTDQRWPQLTGDAVFHVLEEVDGSVWISTDGNGLLKLDVQAETITRVGGTNGAQIPLPSDRIAKVLRDADGHLWIATLDAGVTRVDVATSRVTLIDRARGAMNSSSRPINVKDVFQDRDGKILLATDSGLGLVDAKEGMIDFLPIRGLTLSAPNLNTLLQDRSGRYWIGAYQGVYSGIRTPFTTINADSGLDEEVVLSVARTDEGSLWIGSTGGLHRIAPGEERGQRVAASDDFDLQRSGVTSLFPDGGSLWVGTNNSGLYKVNLTTGQLSHHYASFTDHSHGMVSDQITAILRDTFGNLWVGTYKAGLQVLRPGSDEFVQYAHDPDDITSVSGDTVFALYQERNGDLWIGTTAGLNRFNYDTGTFDRFIHDRDDPDSLSSQTIYSIYEDSAARLWVGTHMGGLNMWEPVDRKSSLGRFRHFPTSIDLPSSNVYAIQGDESGNLWLATSGGLTRFNFDDNSFKNYTVEDGLQGNDFNLGASFQDTTGRLYFGGSSGLNFFYPERVKDNPVKPPVALTRVSLVNEQVFFDEPYEQLREIHLDPQDYMLGFEFAALDFNAPGRNQYKYQLVGLDKNWIDLGNRNTVTFTNLPTGQYVFRVQGSNSDGVWNRDGISLNIVVHPPFYLTWWAFFFYIVCFLLVNMYFVYRQREKEQLRMQYQAQLESDVRARTRDLRRANDKLQSAVDEIGKARLEAVEANQAKSEFLAALSHEIRTPMHGVLGMTDLLQHSGLSDRQLGFAESAHESANELLGLIDNILDFSKIEAGKMELEETTFNLREVVENLCYLYGELAQTKNIELNLVFNAALRRQVYGDPVRLRQILQNLLSNAIKFTKRGAVTIVVDEVSRRDKTVNLRFTVDDTGIGMDEDTVQRIFEAFSQADSSTTRQYGGTGLGLSIAKQLIELMEGELSVTSKPGVGTTMAVSLGLTESPIYSDKLSVSAMENYYAEVVAPMPETRAMMRSQLEALSLQVRECTVIEEIPQRSDQPRLVFVDVGSLYDNACIAAVDNLSQEPATKVLLVAPLSLEGIPQALEGLPHTTKPARLAGLINDILGALSAEGEGKDGEEEAPLSLFNRRILLVEDMTANQEIARAMLESFGCSVAIAKNGDVALEMYQQDEYDIILMDCQMPVMDGFAATRHIRKMEASHSDGKRMPIVALTAGKTEAEKERCYACGMDRILFKPYSTRDLNSILSQYFDAVGEVQPPRAPPTERESSSEILDLNALENIRSVEVQTGNNLLAKVFDNFKQDVETKLEELRDNADDPSALGAGAHAIKSMSLNIGAKALSDYCRRCETNWKKGDTGDARREIEVLRGHYMDAVRALERVIETSVDTVD